MFERKLNCSKRKLFDLYDQMAILFVQYLAVYNFEK